MNTARNIDQQITIGAFYELPDGRIARLFGAGRGTVRYYFDDGQGERIASADEVASSWKQTALEDFPNARDPRLPYAFDLFYDIKHLSELRDALAAGGTESASVDELMDLVRRHGLEEQLLATTDLDASEGSDLDGAEPPHGPRAHCPIINR